MKELEADVKEEIARASEDNNDKQQKNLNKSEHIWKHCDARHDGTNGAE